jgi:hypothetical protein
VVAVLCLSVVGCDHTIYIGAWWDVVTGFTLERGGMWLQDLHWSVVGCGHRIYIGAWWDVVTGFTLECSGMR